MYAIQIPAIILPILAPMGTETELVADALTHVSIEPMAEDTGSIAQYWDEKTAFIFAQEVVVLGIPSNLLIWVEESPYPTVITPSFWGALGGGGGALPPLVFDTIVGTGVDGTIHTLPIHWNSYSPYIRVVVQTPIPAAAAGWAVQVVLAGKGAA